MIIKNGSVFTSDGFEKKDIAFDTSHRIMAALPSADPDVFDAEGCYVVPGFIDIHTHLGLSTSGVGMEGEDFNEESEPCTAHIRIVAIPLSLQEKQA